VKDALGCSGSYTTAIAKKVPGRSTNCSAGEDHVIIEGDKAVATITTASAATISWSPNTSSPTVDDNKFVLYPSTNTYYKLTVTYPNGCVCEDEVLVEVRKQMDIPNTFTPNGDEKNDKFTIKFTENYRDVEITIVDRWGSTVYHTTNYSDDNAWDGTAGGSKVPVAVYYYVIRFKYHESKKDDNSYYYQGSINLIR
jgi:gliding motility-associated-like protein